MKKNVPVELREAVALFYDGETVPRVTAKGHGDVAEQIIRLAEEHGVPLHEDRDLMVLLSQLELGDEIPRALYIAVAEVIAFAYMLKGKMPKNWQGPGGSGENQ
jgi:flagellar biosynthesis protein